MKERSDTGVYVKGLSNRTVKTAQEMDSIMTQGNQNRALCVRSLYKSAHISVLCGHARMYLLVSTLSSFLSSSCISLIRPLLSFSLRYGGCHQYERAVFTLPCHLFRFCGAPGQGKQKRITLACMWEYLQALSTCRARTTLTLCAWASSISSISLWDWTCYQGLHWLLLLL